MKVHKIILMVFSLRKRGFIPAGITIMSQIIMILHPTLNLVRYMSRHLVLLILYRHIFASWILLWSLVGSGNFFRLTRKGKLKLIYFNLCQQLMSFLMNIVIDLFVWIYPPPCWLTNVQAYVDMHHGVKNWWHL